MGKQTFPPTSTIKVTDGVTTVDDIRELNFTSGVTVTNAGGGTADAAASGGGGAGINLIVQAAIGAQ